MIFVLFYNKIASSALLSRANFNVLPFLPFTTCVFLLVSAVYQYISHQFSMSLYYSLNFVVFLAVARAISSSIFRIYIL